MQKALEGIVFCEAGHAEISDAVRCTRAAERVVE
jgi:hypothetical protein